MKTISLMAITLAIMLSANAQVQVGPLPKFGYEQRIRDAVNQMKVVDTHEHLRSFDRLKTECTPDFMFLLFDYISDDIVSAGMPRQDFNKLCTNSLTVMEKWQAIKPYWEGASNTVYCRQALLEAKQLFGIKNIDSTTIEELSKKINIAYKNPDEWFYNVLKEKCKIEYVVADRWDFHHDPFYDTDIFKFVYNIHDVINISSKGDIYNFSKWKSTGANTVNDLVSAMQTEFNTAKGEGMVGIKCSVAYQRILFFEDVKREKAEDVFNKIMNSSGESLSFDEVKPLQDYMMHRVLDWAKANNMPVQIHTGLQCFNGNIIENSKPTHLVNLFQKYPDVKFILFHGSYPYGGELSTLAKNFPNVYIDMCWLYMISPSYSERYLHEWLETVPASKIMAFGGDYANVEGTYSHLVFARQVVSNVLIVKVMDGYFTEKEAIKIAGLILHDNAVRILNLK